MGVTKIAGFMPTPMLSQTFMVMQQLYLEICLFGFEMLRNSSLTSKHKKEKKSVEGSVRENLEFLLINDPCGC